MSLKVYRAYRLKNTKDFWSLTRDIKTVGTQKIKARLGKFFLKLMDNVDVDSEDYKKSIAFGESDGYARAHVVEALLRVCGQNH